MYKCVGCTMPIDGTIYGAGDGTGQQFRCVQCHLELQIKERDAEIYRLRRQFQLLQSFNNLRIRAEHRPRVRIMSFGDRFLTVKERDSQARCCPCVEDMRKYATDALAIKPGFVPKDWP